MSADFVILLLAVSRLLLLVPTAVGLYRSLPEVELEQQEMLAQCRAAAEAHYRAHRVTSPDDALSFDPDVAVVVTEEESFGRRPRDRSWYYRMERIVRNPSGEYFKLVYSHEGIARFAHIAHQVAKVVLGDRYRQAPPRAANPNANSSADAGSGTGGGAT